MEEPRSGFQTGDFEQHRVAYEDGQLVIEVKGPGRSTWTMRSFGDWPLVDVEGTAHWPDPAVGGFYGLTCGRSDQDFYAGLLDPSGGTVLLRVLGGQATVLLRDDTPAPDVSGGEPIELRFSCSGTDAGGDAWLSLSVGERLVASAADPSGFVSFLRGGFYIESGDSPEGALMTGDDFRVVAGLVSGGGPIPTLPTGGDPVVEALLSHVPETLRELCREVFPSDQEATVAVDCGTPEVPVATYLQYAGPEAMMGDYEELLEERSDATGSSCEREPGEGPYTVDGVETGRLLCFLDEGAATLYWTDQRLSIMGHARAADGSFADLYAWWLGAGPLP